MLKGHIGKEIERKVRKCMIEEGHTEDECISVIESEYDLEPCDKKEIEHLIKYYKNL